jgi:peptidoglycan/LPS O-acetylase OafA/YrhL
LQGLQALRGVAALLAMWCHLKYNLGTPFQRFWNWSWLITDIWAIGVDIFFVISGYVIAMSAAGLGKNWRVFLAHRIARIVPLYFSVSIFWLVLIAAGCPDTGADVPGFREIFNTFNFIPYLTAPPTPIRCP